MQKTARIVIAGAIVLVCQVAFGQANPEPVPGQDGKTNQFETAAIAELKVGDNEKAAALFCRALKAYSESGNVPAAVRVVKSIPFRRLTADDAKRVALVAWKSFPEQGAERIRKRLEQVCFLTGADPDAGNVDDSDVVSIKWVTLEGAVIPETGDTLTTTEFKTIREAWGDRWARAVELTGAENVNCVPKPGSIMYYRARGLREAIEAEARSGTVDDSVDELWDQYYRAIGEAFARRLQGRTR